MACHLSVYSDCEWKCSDLCSNMVIQCPFLQPARCTFARKYDIEYNSPLFPLFSAWLRARMPAMRDSDTSQLCQPCVYTALILLAGLRRNVCLASCKIEGEIGRMIAEIMRVLGAVNRGGPGTAQLYSFTTGDFSRGDRDRYRKTVVGDWERISSVGNLNRQERAY